MKQIKKLTNNKLFLLIALLVLLFLFSSLQSSSFFNSNNNDERDKEEVLSEETEKGKSKEEGEDKDREITKVPTSTPKPTLNNPTNTPVPQNTGSLNSFIYPNGNVATNNGSTAVINSSDNPDQITNWYEDKIEEHNMNTTSVVRTNTNGEVLNKISASNGELSIEVEISRSNNDANTKITVKLL